MSFLFFTKQTQAQQKHNHTEGKRERQREISDGEGDFLSRKGEPFKRASVVWGDEAKNGSIPPTRGLRVRERGRDKRRKRDKIK